MQFLPAVLFQLSVHKRDKTLFRAAAEIAHVRRARAPHARALASRHVANAMRTAGDDRVPQPHLP
jgi:hypothetical protein